eukprot:TRINITY_DN8402_c0_g1_i3.p1 TRINITY_DN8402_c0_g1~~TRINITY_DN8402_c0_g1_i3.p1  ORF type:complete len:175 (+),score=3.12 TRINITY_DN8402_c0_g1_i3:282-806(+)
MPIKVAKKKKKKKQNVKFHKFQQIISTLVENDCQPITLVNQILQKVTNHYRKSFSANNHYRNTQHHRNNSFHRQGGGGGGVGDLYNRTLFFKLVTEIESILKLMVGWVQDIHLFCFLGCKCYVSTLNNVSWDVSFRGGIHQFTESFVYVHFDSASNISICRMRLTFISGTHVPL